MALPEGSLEVSEPQLNTTQISVWQPPYRSLTIGLMLTITVAAFEMLAVSTILPAITRDLGGLELYGWAFSAFLLAKLIGTTVAGSEVDRQGPGVPFSIGIAVFVAGLFIGGLAPTMLVLIVGRAIQGLGSGVIGSVSYAIIARGYPDTIRARMLALNSTAWVIPGLIGPAIAGAIGDFVGWRWVFLGLVPLPLIAAWLTHSALHGLAREATTPRQWQQTVRSVQLAMGATLLMIGLGQALPLGGLLAVVGIGIGAPALYRLLPKGAFRAAAGMPAAIACMGLLTLSFFGVDAFLPLVMTELRGLSSTVTGLGLTAATCTWTLGAWMLDRYATRFSRRSFALFGFLLIIVGEALSIMMLYPQFPALLVVATWAIIGLGMGLAYTTLSLVTLELAPPGQEGASSAALQVNDVLGSALGTGIGGALIAANSMNGINGTVNALQIQFILMIGVALIAIVAAVRLPTK